MKEIYIIVWRTFIAERHLDGGFWMACETLERAEKELAGLEVWLNSKPENKRVFRVNNEVTNGVCAVNQEDVLTSYYLEKTILHK